MFSINIGLLSINVPLALQAIFFNILLLAITRYFNNKNTFSRIFAVICILPIIGFAASIWADRSEHFAFNLILMEASYINVCYYCRELFSPIKCKIMFVFLSLLYLWWATILFGKLYYECGVVGTEFYEQQVNYILNQNEFFIIKNLNLTKIYFAIGLEHYFASPVGIKDNIFQIIQFIYGILAQGTILAMAFDMVNRLIRPTYTTKTRFKFRK